MNGPRIGLIWAEATGRAIGLDGALPWYLPEDLAHFKNMTMGAPVVMGRRTWFSLPEKFRPLPGRPNYVVTSAAPEGKIYAGAHVVDSLKAGITAATKHLRTENCQTEHAVADLWIIGGAQLFLAALPYAVTVSLTRIDVKIPGADTFAPKLTERWHATEIGAWQQSRTGLKYRVELWNNLRNP